MNWAGPHGGGYLLMVGFPVVLALAVIVGYYVVEFDIALIDWFRLVWGCC